MTPAKPLRPVLSMSDKLARATALAAARFGERIHEARVTTSLELLIVLYGVISVYQSVVQGGGYTQGWAILGKGITQQAYGWVLAVQCAVRLFAVLFGSRAWRYRTAWSSLYIHGTVAYAVREANPPSPMLAALVSVGVVANLWVIGALVWTPHERPA